MIFLFILKMLYSVYTLESPRLYDSNESTQKYRDVKENREDIPFMLPDLAL